MYKLLVILLLSAICSSIATNGCQLHPMDQLKHLINRTCPIEFDEQCVWPFDIGRLVSNKLVCGRRRRGWYNYISIIYLLVGFFVDDHLEIVHIINSTLLSELVNRRSSTTVTSVDEPWCMLTNFYSSSCPFSNRLAPYYNALARVFPRLLVVAIDASDYSKLNSRYGITGTPCLILWHNGIAVARYDDVDYTLTSIVSFITQWTDLNAIVNVDVNDGDRIGPLTSGDDESIDYLLLCAWAFIAYAIGYYGSRSRVAIRLWTAICTNFREANE